MKIRILANHNKNRMDPVSNEHKEIFDLEDILAWTCLQIAYIRSSTANIQKSLEALKKRGESEARLQELRGWRQSTVFTKRERAALGLAEASSLNRSEALLQPILKEVKRYFSRQEMIHLTLSITAANDWVDHPSDSLVRVLVVEDDPDDRELLSWQLQKAGMKKNVIFVSSAPEALALVKNSQEAPFGYDWIAIFLDIHLPGMDGIELLRRIRAMASGEEIPVIIMTSSRDPRHVEECAQLKVASYVEKPVTYSAFAKAIANIFHRTRETTRLPLTL